MAAAVGESKEITWNICVGDEVGEEMEIFDLEGGGRRRAEVEEGLTVAAVLRARRAKFVYRNMGLYLCYL
jgi:hypothetical protein